MSVFVRYGGRRERIALPSRHVPVHGVVAAAVKAFGLEGTGREYALRSARAARVAKPMSAKPLSGDHLKKRSNTLDPAATWAHCGLDNNADLDLVEVSSSTTEGSKRPVRVAVRGSGLKAFETEADASSPLSSLLTEWRRQKKLPRPCAQVRILRDTFAGDALSTTTLKALGYGPGAAVRLDLALREDGDDETNAPVEEQEEETPGGGQDSKKTSVPPPPKPHETNVEETAAPMDVDDGAPPSVVPEPPRSQQQQQQQQQQQPATPSTSLPRAIAQLLDAPPALRAACARTLLKYAKALRDAPAEARFRNINAENAAFAAKVAPVPGGCDVLTALGFVASDGHLVMRDDGPDPRLLALAIRDLTAMTQREEEEGQRGGEAPSQQGRSDQSSSFDPFRSSRIDVASRERPAMTTRFESDADRELRRLKARREKLLAGEPRVPADRDVTVSSRSASSSSEQPLQNTNVVVANTTNNTSQDAALLRAAAASRASKARDRHDAPLETQAARDVRKLRAEPLYATSRLKIVVYTDFVVAATFGASETIADVLSFLSALRATGLYVTPPRRDLDPALSLDQAGLVPAALVYARLSPPSSSSGEHAASCTAVAEALGATILAPGVDDALFPEPLLAPAGSQHPPTTRANVGGGGGGGAPPRRSGGGAGAATGATRPENDDETGGDDGTTKRSKRTFAWLKTGK